MADLYLNCTAGIAGDMFAGALLDSGIAPGYLLKELKKLRLANFGIKIHKVKKKGILATKFDVITKPEHHHRHLSDINAMIDASALKLSVKSLAKKIFLNLGKAEAEVHKVPLNQVHFHEVGAIDSIVDIVAAAILLDKLKPTKVYCSSIAEGHGKITFSHGITELPVPAVRILLKDAPLTIRDVNKEMITPTGAAIVKTIVDEFIDESHFSADKKGFGAGTREMDFPNVLEARLGKANMPKLLLLETNIDDMNPELCPYIIDQLIKSGAREAFVKPIIMKKARPGMLLSVICDPGKKDSLIEIIFRETTTFGVRVNNLHRVILDREFQKVKTPLGNITIKIGKFKNKVTAVKLEYEECRKIAEQKKMPLKEVYHKLQRYAWQHLGAKDEKTL